MFEDLGLFGAPEPLQERDGDRAGLVDAHVRHEPFEWLVVADEQADPRPGSTPRSCSPRAS